MIIIEKGEQKDFLFCLFTPFTFVENLTFCALFLCLGNVSRIMLKALKIEFLLQNLSFFVVEPLTLTNKGEQHKIVRRIV